jgi:tetratricopeptide (TPR) repeat protein
MGIQSRGFQKESFLSFNFFLLQFHTTIHKADDKLIMTIIKEYQYKERWQRVSALIFSFLLHICAGMVLSTVLLYAKTVFFYQPVFKRIVIFTLTFHLLGILSGGYIFKKIKKSRALFIIISLLGVLSYLVYGLKSLFISDMYAFFLSILKASSPLIFLLLGVIPFLTGILNDYFIKIFSGTYFDEKKGTHTFLILMILGLASGVLFQFGLSYYGLSDLFSLIPCVVAIPFVFIVRLEYTPEPFYAQELGDHSGEEDVHKGKNKDIFFNYLNFLYIAIYIFLGLLTFSKHYGDMLYVKLLFLGVVFGCMAVGFVLSSFVKRTFWHIYSEMFYPFFFLFFFIMLIRFAGRMEFYLSVLFIVPLALTFGLTLFHSVKNILSKYDQDKGHKIIVFSTFLIPLPIIIALSYVVFTNRWFFIFFYVLSFLNVLFPGIHLARTRGHSYAKGFYFLLFAIVVPSFILMHLYFSIKLDKKLYVQYTTNYEAIYDISSQSNYFDVTSEIYLNNARVMKISDQFIRNLRRAVLSLSLFADNDKDDFLFLDGNRKFFENNLYEVFKNSECLDYIADKQVDYNRLPVSNKKSIVTFKSDIFSHLKNRDRKYSFIVDIPNIYDQNYNAFRFTPTYYNYIKEYLSGKEVFVQFIQPSSANIQLANNALASFSHVFKNSTSLFLGETLVLLGSDRDDFTITQKNLDNLNFRISSKKEYKSLFYREVHMLSYFFQKHIDADFSFYKAKNYFTVPFRSDKTSFIYDDALFDQFLDTHDTVFSMNFLPDSPGGKQSMKLLMDSQSNILGLLKRSESAALKKDYIQEALYLKELQKEGESDYDIRHYISGMISLKELTYVRAASEYEEARNWNRAREIYKSILILNADNFDANYRLGILSLMLQEADTAFEYFQKSLKLAPNNPRVLFQMGVMHFSRTEYRDALVFLQRSINYGYDRPMAYFYIGRCYEQLHKYKDARKFYLTAQYKDPNNTDIEGQLNRINKIIDELYSYEAVERVNQNEEEEGEYIPLPINQNAIDKRIMEDELYKYAPADKSSGSKYGEKFAAPPGEESSGDGGNKGFFDLFGAEGE